MHGATIKIGHYIIPRFLKLIKISLGRKFPQQE
jgi:hypothetical protein